MGEIEILKDALTSLKTKQVQIEQQMAIPDSTSGGCTCGRNNIDEETAAVIRRGDQPLVNWLRNQHYDNETILKVNKPCHEITRSYKYNSKLNIEYLKRKVLYY